ncbi:hypothetical protein [Thiohalomonas denitrificans]|uniref:hypothetical protein n=1 Tax=Thiohalomonas denitrificans TaxID=415747 RepID=UPI0026F17B3C|nr:hypothetical protein [Thiohalomonas denitrificans]
MTRLLLPLLLGLFPAFVAAAEVSLLYGRQGGGQLEDLDSGTSLDLAEEPVRGLLIGTPLDARRDLELLYGRQKTRLRDNAAVGEEALAAIDIHYLHLGGTVLSDHFEGWQGFLSGGLGLTHFSPRPGGQDSETRASLSVGLGARWMATRTVGVRLEARGFGTLFNNNTSVFCSGGCAFAVSGDLLTQYAVMGGVVIRFD